MWEPSGYIWQCSANTRNPIKKQAYFSRKLHPWCIQGTPCCAVILALQAPFFRGRIVVCQAIGHLIGGVRGTGTTQSVDHHLLLFFHGIYIHQILQVTSWNLVVTRHVRPAPPTAKGTLCSSKFRHYSWPCCVKPEKNIFARVRARGQREDGGGIDTIRNEVHIPGKVLFDKAGIRTSVE